jgi:hypothetical protein
VTLTFVRQIPRKLGFAILEEIKEGLVDALYGSEEFVDPQGLASYFVCGRVRGYGVCPLRPGIP